MIRTTIDLGQRPTLARNAAFADIAKGTRMITPQWREEPNGTFAAATEGFRLEVRRRANGRQARFVVFKQSDVNPDALVDSGVRGDIGAAMIAAESSAEQLSRVAKRHSLLVLVVSHDEVMRGAIAEVLRKGGYDAIENGSAEGALRRLQHTSRPVLLIFGGQTADGADGQEFAAAARAVRPSVHVLFISDSLLCHGCTSKEDFLIEPFSAEQLLRRVSMVDARLQIAVPAEAIPLVSRDRRSWFNAGLRQVREGGRGRKL